MKKESSARGILRLAFGEMIVEMKEALREFGKTVLISLVIAGFGVGMALIGERLTPPMPFMMSLIFVNWLVVLGLLFNIKNKVKKMKEMQEEKELYA